MDKVLVFGHGNIGKTIAKLLARKWKVIVLDKNKIEDRSLPYDYRELDIKNLDYENDIFIDAKAIISCLPYFCNQYITKIAVNLDIPYFDLTEDVNFTNWLRDYVKNSKAPFVSQCGLAPGFINILGNHLLSQLSDPFSLKLRVGAIPQYPNNYLRYGISWSVDGLINEYLNQGESLVNGEIVINDSLAEIERLIIDNEEYEAFNTSGGVGSLVSDLKNSGLKSLSYKTIRHTDHCERMRVLAYELNLSQNRDLFKQVLLQALPVINDDKVVILAEAISNKSSKKYEKIIFPEKGLTAIQLTTSHGLLAIFEEVMTNLDKYQGYVNHSRINYDNFIANEYGKIYAVD